MRISDSSSDVCSSDLSRAILPTRSSNRSRPRLCFPIQRVRVATMLTGSPSPTRNISSSEELSPESRKFLVKQGHDSVVVELDLTGLDDELSVLSGRAETTPIAVQAAAEFGPDPANWLPVFHQRRRPS